MKRHEALHDLSRDHFFALRCAREIQEAGEADLAEAAESLEHLWRADLQPHFRQEEEVLLPLLARHGPILDHPVVRQVLEDHAWLRDRIPEVARRRRDGEAWEALVREVGRRLHDHVRLEERELFGLLEGLLAEPGLGELARLGRDFRLRHRGPESLGPHRADP